MGGSRDMEFIAHRINTVEELKNCLRSMALNWI